MVTHTPPVPTNLGPLAAQALARTRATGLHGNDLAMVLLCAAAMAALDSGHDPDTALPLAIATARAARKERE